MGRVGCRNRWVHRTVTDAVDLFERLKASLADQYEVVREIGAGGMAIVFFARDLKHDREVALKVFRPELAVAVGVDRFLREIQIAAKLSHPHILPLYDSGEVDGFLYYTMPFVDGESLAERMEREKMLPLDDAQQIAREVADALNYAHTRDLVHRDIKPDNIMLTGGHTLVMDFGIARALEAAGGTSLTGGERPSAFLGRAGSVVRGDGVLLQSRWLQQWQHLPQQLPSCTSGVDGLRWRSLGRRFWRPSGGYRADSQCEGV